MSVRIVKNKDEEELIEKEHFMFGVMRKTAANSHNPSHRGNNKLFHNKVLVRI